MPKLADFLEERKKIEMQDLYNQMLERESIMRGVGVPVATGMYSNLQEAMGKLKFPSKPIVITASGTRNIPEEQVKTASELAERAKEPISYKGYLKTAKDTKHLFETIPPEPTGEDYAKALQSIRQGGLDQPMKGVMLNPKTGEKKIVTIAEGIKALETKPITAKDYSMMKVAEEFGIDINTDLDLAANLAHHADQLPEYQRRDFMEAVRQISSGRESDKEYSPQALVDMGATRKFLEDEGYTIGEDESAVSALNRIARETPDREGFLKRLNETLKPTEERRQIALDKIFNNTNRLADRYETMDREDELAVSSGLPPKYSPEQKTRMRSQISRQKDLYMGIRQNLTQEDADYWDAMFGGVFFPPAPQGTQETVPTTSQPVQSVTPQAVTPQTANQGITKEDAIAELKRRGLI